ncbi:PREDICTED: putative nuclease HARBI1 [Vollenhovia emeryi]|uniref:putative nuclease HARBI1 n=1 Tax=Vollenhovia emeryi TaxID=411798 RepID=UPI0005F42B4F|nr:PREDICTED: putative nuclease HARBI1 [Vollenhovia emeryi]
MAIIDSIELRRNRLISLVITTSDNFLESSLNITNDSDPDEEINTILLAKYQQRLRGVRRKPLRIIGYVERTVPSLTAKQFREHFRMTPAAYETLEMKLSASLSKTSHSGKPTIPVRKQLLSTLWILATPDSYRSVGERFDMGKSSVSDSFMRVVKALNDIAGDVIVWPQGDRRAAVYENFQRIGRLPHVIGAIDGTNIPIKAPKVDARFYISKDKEYAITLQAVCDAELRFLDCFAGFAGSVGDRRVFRNSDLWKEVMRNRASYFMDQDYIIGDKAYPYLSWLIPPFINLGQLTENQKKFNTALSSMRQVIERAFALLKGRWRRLKFLDMNRDDVIPFVILASCVLHNICLDNGLEDYEDFIDEGPENNNDEDDVHLLRNPVNFQNDPEGVLKRQYLVTLLR